MKKYLTYLSSRADEHIIEYGLGDWFDLGPNHPGYSQLTSKGVTATGIYYYDLSVMNEVAVLLGFEEDSRYYKKQMKEVKLAYNNRFYHQDKGYYDRNNQTANAVSLFYELVYGAQNEAYKTIY